MTTPSLELNIKASGVQEVKALKAALAELNGEVGKLSTYKNVSALDQLAQEMKGLRGDLKAAMTEITKTLTEGVKGAFQGAQQQAVQGAKDLEKTFNDTMRSLVQSVDKRNQEIAKRTAELNGKLASDSAKGGEAVGASFAAGLEKSAAKVRVAYSVALGGGARAGLSVNGLGNLNVLMEEAKKVEASIPAVEASYAKAIAALEKNVAAIMKAATQGPNTMRNEGYIAWWNRVVSDMEKGEAALAAEYAKAIATLDKQVAEVMKAATQGPNTMRGPGYIAWWNRVIDDMEEGEARLLREYETSIAKLENQVAQVMKAATQGPNTLRGKGYIAWWDKVIDEIEAGEAKLAKEYADSITRLERTTANVMKAALQAPNTMRGKGYISWWDQVIDDMEKGEAKLEAKQLELQRRQVAVATSMAAGPFSVSEGAGLGREIVPKAATVPSATPDPGKLSAISQALRTFTVDANDAHSAARGLASGFGLLWLTWGTLLPLLAGAAISNAFMQVIRLGADLNNTFAQIRILTEQSADSVGMLEQRLTELARTGPIGPTEIAKAMKILSLAGLDAEKTYAATKDVLNFAVAGDTTIEKAADVLTTVATAFNVSADAYSYVGDTIAVAAAQSKSSVESMGDAFKTASVINQQYGVTLEDTAVGLSLLANAGIQGTAAGTALRNMYADLAGRTPKVEKALRELGVNALDPLTGKMREQAAVFKDLMNALSQRTPTAQFKYIQDIFSERGGKEAVAILNEMRKSAEDTGQAVGSMYEALAEKISEAAGFTAVAAAKMALTPLNQMKSVAATLQTSLSESFKALEPTINEVSNRLKEVFNSSDFKDAVTALAEAVGRFTVFLLEHARAIATVVLAWVAFKGAVSVVEGYVATLDRLAKVNAAMKAAEAGGAVSSLARGATLLTGALGVLGGVVTAVAAAWALYSLWADRAKEKQEVLATDNAQALLDKLQEEETRLERVNEARSRGISLMQLEAQIALEKARDETTPEMLKAQTDYAANEASISKIVNSRYAQEMGAEKALAPLYAKRAELQAALDAATAQHGEKLLKIERTIGHIKDLEEESAKAAKDRMAEFKVPSGTLGRPVPLKGLPSDTDMKTIETEFRQQESLYRNFYSDQMALLDNLHKNKLVSEGEYQIRSLQETASYEGKMRELVDDIGQRQLAEYRERIAIAQKIDDPEKRQQALDRLKNEYTTFSATLMGALEKIDNDARKRIGEQANNSLGQIKALDKQSTEYWAKAVDGANKEAALAKARRDLAGATEEERAAFEARVRVESSFGDELRKLQTAYDDAADSVKAYNAALDAGPPVEEVQKYGEAATAALNAAAARLERAKQALDQIKNTAVSAALDEVENKKVQELRDNAKSLAKSTGSAIVDALLTGGETGIKKLRDAVKQAFLAPIKVVLQAAMQPFANTLVNAGYSALGLGNATNTLSGANNLLGTGSLLSSFGNSWSLSNVGTMGQGVGGFLGFGTAAAGGSNAMAALTATNAANTGAAASGSLELVGSAASNAAGAGIMGTIGAAMPYIGIALMAAQALGLFDHGGPKTDSSFGFKEPSVAGDSAAAQSIVQGISQTYTPLATQLGVASSDIKWVQQTLGALVSQDPQGTAQTILDLHAGTYDRGTMMGTTENVGRSDADLQTAIALASAQLIIKNLQDQVSGPVGDYLKSINVATASLEDMNKALKVAQDVAAFNKVVEAMGAAFTNLKGLSVDSAEALVTAFGSVDNLTSKLSGFYNTFFTQEEKHTALQTYLNDEFAKLNITLPTSIKGYKELVLAQKLDTQSGRDTYTALINLSSAFSDLMTSVDDTTTSISDLTDVQTALDDSASKAKALLQKAYDNEYERLTQLRDRMQSFNDKLSAFLQELKTGDLAGLTPQQKYFSAKAEFEKYAQNLNSTDPLLRDEALSNIEQAGRDLLDASRQMNGASDGYYADLSEVADAVTQAKDLSKTGVDVATSQLTTLNTLVNGLVDVKDAVSHGLADLYDLNGRGLLNLLDGTGEVHDGVLDLNSIMDSDLRNLLSSLDTNHDGLIDLNGTTGTGLSAVVTAIQNLQAALTAAAGGPQPGDDTLKAGINALYQMDLGRNAEPGGLAFYMDLMKNSGYSISDVERLIKNSPEYLAHMGGISGAITSYYEKYLGRAPEPDGMNFYTNLYNSGTPITAIEEMIKHSPEATAHNGGVPLRAGLDRVPYDNFPATLHKNEAVLNAATAERWRNDSDAAARMTQELLGRVSRLERTFSDGVDRLVGAQFASTDKAAEKIANSHKETADQSGWRTHTREKAKKK